MPVSEDEFERPVQIGTNQSAMSKAEQRKSNKPIMEKRRRARINHCLNELKTLILDAMKKDPARHSKLEKADILEMTVKHLQQIQRQQLATAVATDPLVLMRFKSGFDECAAEVNRYISSLDTVDSGVKQRLAAHLHRCVSSIQQISTYPHPNMFSTITQNCDNKNPLVLSNVPTIPGDVNNNSNQNADRIQIPSGLHLIPSRLPTGELALLVPNSSHMSTFVNAASGATFQFPHNTSITVGSVTNSTIGGSLNANTNHTSAFTAVSKNDYPSPTSTNDVIKKESTLPEKDEYSNPYMDHPHFNAQVTDSNNGADKFSDAHLQKYTLAEGKFKSFAKEQKVLQRASSSFQRSVADSTTSFIPLKETEVAEFKPFQVEIPNTHVKAHISISDSSEEAKKNSLQIQQKPNPNFTLNPNKLNHKYNHKFTRNSGNPENGFAELGKCEIGLEKFLKIEPISAVQTEETNLLRPSSETFQNIEGMINKFKRPLSVKSTTEMAAQSSSDSPSKVPRISLNVTLTDDREKDEANHCKRISVIVEDSSKGAGKESQNEVAVNVASQKDMWRPW